MRASAMISAERACRIAAVALEARAIDSRLRGNPFFGVIQHEFDAMARDEAAACDAKRARQVRIDADTDINTYRRPRARARLSRVSVVSGCAASILRGNETLRRSSPPAVLRSHRPPGG